MLDLDGRVVGDLRELRLELFHNAHRMRWTVPEIGIAEGDVSGSERDLLPNIVEYHVALNHTKLALIYGHDRTVAAEMFAAAAGFCIGDYLPADFCVRCRNIAAGGFDER